MAPARRATTGTTSADDFPSTSRRRPAAVAGFAAAVVVAAVVTSSVVAGPSPPSSAQGEDAPRSDCPAMTDSVRRLYKAFFLREPTDAEFREQTIAYRTGEARLDEIAQALADTTEFDERYPGTDDTDFVEIVYRNVLRSTPTDREIDNWIDTLDTGFSRGRMMVSFTESERFADFTNTATPLSGYLKQYPSGAHWYCGAGPRNGLGTQSLEGEGLRADFLFHNAGNARTDIGLHTVNESERNVTMLTGTLAPGHTQYNWDGDFEGDGFYGSGLDIDASDRTSWIIVFYRGTLGEDRLGWQIEPDRT